eukprot:5749928-Amphidinium_carterae.1
MEDMLCAWTKVTPSEQFRSESVGSSVSQESVTLMLAMSVRTLSVVAMGFTPSETLGANYLVDSTTLPSCMWHGIILLERCGVSAMDPPLSVVPLDVCVVDGVWSLLACGSVGEHDLRDGSKLCLFTPQRKLPMLDLEFEVDMLAYQVILAL